MECRLEVTRVPNEMLKSSGGGEAAFLELCRRVSLALGKALSSDHKVVILSQDSDNLGAAALIYYMIE
jgi:hypothetical protein